MQAPAAQQPMEVDQPTKNSSSSANVATTVEMESIIFEDIREQCRTVERAETTKETRLVYRVLRSLITTRKQLSTNVLIRLVNYYFIGSVASKIKVELLAYLKAGEVDHVASAEHQSGGASSGPPPPKSPRQLRAKPFLASGSGSSGSFGPGASSLLPEVETYLHLLIVLHLMNEKRYEDADKCIGSLISRLETHNKRSLDPLVAKVYYFYSVIAGILNNGTKLIDSHIFFHARLRIATSRHDEDSQATLINCLLRAYLSAKSFDSAASLIATVTFPISSNTNEWARYHYYVGCIRAKESQYPEAKQALQLALRKAPQQTAIGFRQAVQKLLVTVDLLMGHLSERSLFREAIYRKPLAPYLQLSQAVRVGDVERFDQTLTKFAQQLDRDGTYDLAVHLRQNVIKTAVRQISLAYSRISLTDVKKKLHLTETQDAANILAKAIKEGVIDAELDLDNNWLKMKESADLYGTSLPQNEYHKRIQFCLDVHVQAVKAMRFPPKSYVKEGETADEKREREKQELEFAKEMAEEEEDDFS